MGKVHRHLLALGEAVEHAFQRELAADAALLVAAVGVARRLAKSLVDLNPARLDGMSGAQPLADVKAGSLIARGRLAIVGGKEGGRAMQETASGRPAGPRSLSTR